MRANKYGIKRFKGVRLDRGLVYFWVPPIPLQKARIFRHTTLGTDFGRAIAKACELNSKLGSYRGDSAGIKRTLTLIRPMTVGFLVREFESSPRFARYAPRTRQDYAFIYRDVETNFIDSLRMFGELNYADVTKQLAYTLYEQYVVRHGNDSANKAMGAWQAVFKYGMLKIAQITFNPFLQLDKQGSPSRRQRWTDQQLDAFIKKANSGGAERGRPSRRSRPVKCCAA